jgi:hypothetical protein
MDSHQGLGDTLVLGDVGLMAETWPADLVADHAGAKAADFAIQLLGLAAAVAALA